MTGKSQLTITDMTVFTLRVPVIGTRKQGIGDVSSAFSTVLIKLETDAGICGWGEASPWPVFTGTVEATAAALHLYLRPLVIGSDPFRLEAILAKADRSLVHCNEAKAAIETALLDICGRALGVPLTNLIGGRVNDRLPLSYSIASPDIEQDVERAKELYRGGHRIFKVKTGFAGHAEDCRRLDRFRSDMPDDIDMRVDYNQGLRPFEALRMLRDIEAFDPTFIEQPVPARQIEAMADITAALDTPIMADESVFDPIDAIAAVRAGAADLFSLKIMKSGGIIRAREIAAIGRGAGIDVYGGCMFETGVAHAAGTHLIASLSNAGLGCEFYQATYYLKEDVLNEPFPIEGGEIVVPTAPGLGVTVNEDRVRKMATQTLRG